MVSKFCKKWRMGTVPAISRENEDVDKAEKSGTVYSDKCLTSFPTWTSLWAGNRTATLQTALMRVVACEGSDFVSAEDGASSWSCGCGHSSGLDALRAGPLAKSPWIDQRGEGGRRIGQ